jgi:hypothetical protein
MQIRPPFRRGLLVAATLSLTHFAEAERVAWPEYQSVTEGFGVQLKHGHRASAENLDEVRKLGLRWVRRGFLWQSVEKEKGQYDFTHYDRFMEDCKARQLRVLGCIALGNKLHGHVKDPEGREAYAKYAAALAERYKDYDVVWEIWNEPNTMTFWGKHGKKGNSEPYAEEYYHLVAAAVPAIKKADPQAFVMGGSVSGLWTESIKWMDYVFADGVLKTGIDGWSVHPYSFKCPEEYEIVYADMRRQMEKAGGPADLVLLNSERGFPLNKAEGHAGGDPALSREYQAWHVVRQYLIDMYLGAKVTIWYEWDAEPGGKEGFELFRKGEAPKPAYLATKVLIEQLEGFKFEKRLPLEGERDYVFQFRNAAGETRLVAWTAQPRGQTPDKIIPHKVKVPVSGTVSTVSLYGEKRTATPKDGFLELELSGAPRYVILK